MVLNAFDTAQTVIRGNGGAMDELVSTLLERETLSGVALEALLSAVKPYKKPLIPTATSSATRSSTRRRRTP
jgi:hypothetical protein